MGKDVPNACARARVVVMVGTGSVTLPWHRLQLVGVLRVVWWLSVHPSAQQNGSTVSTTVTITKMTEPARCRTVA